MRRYKRKQQQTNFVTLCLFSFRGVSCSFLEKGKEKKNCFGRTLFSPQPHPKIFPIIIIIIIIIIIKKTAENISKDDEGDDEDDMVEVFDIWKGKKK